MVLNVFSEGKKSSLIFCTDIKLIVHFHLRQILGIVGSILWYNFAIASFMEKMCHLYQVFKLYLRNKTLQMGNN